MSDYELVTYNPDPLKSAVMSRASDLRDEGYSKSDALSMAWEDVLGEDYDEEEDEIYDFDDIMNQKTKTRRRNTMTEVNPDSGGIGLMLLLGVGGYLVWCYFTSKYKGLPWSWTPWKLPVSRIARQPIRAIRPPSDNTREHVQLIVP
jgi:hypothetical protein